MVEELRRYSWCRVTRRPAFEHLISTSQPQIPQALLVLNGEAVVNPSRTRRLRQVGVRCNIDRAKLNQERALLVCGRIRSFAPDHRPKEILKKHGRHGARHVFTKP